MEIRQKMTVEELARAMGKDVGESLPCYLGLSETRQLKSALQQLKLARFD